MGRSSSREAVVVALEHEAAAVDADDPVQHLRAELAAVVEDDVAGPVGALLADDGEVASLSPGSIELPTRIAYDVPPPICAGAKNVHAQRARPGEDAARRIPVTRPVLMASCGRPGEGRRSRPAGLRPYEVAITDSSSAVVTAMSGTKLQVTLTPPAIEQFV